MCADLKNVIQGSSDSQSVPKVFRSGTRHKGRPSERSEQKLDKDLV